jgi:hypothetical protein
MKTLLMVAFLFFSAVNLLAQTQAGKDPKIPVIERKAETNPGNVPSPSAAEAPRQRGVSISSAARRSSLQNPPAQGANRHAETTGNANQGQQGKSIANQLRQNRIERPNAGNRPNLRVPAARPSVPIVRPNRPLPNRPIRPIRRPGVRI